MRLRVAFYIAQRNKLLDMAISIWTWPWNIGTINTSHVEIGFEVEPDNWMYASSTMRGKANGPRWISQHDLFKHPERWAVYDLTPCRKVEDMNSLAHNIISQRFDDKENLYDFLGILGFFTPLGQLNSKEKWYCSEFCWIVFTGRWKKRISPRRMYGVLKSLNMIKKI